MKKCCKNINITNPSVILPFIHKCLQKNKRRKAFRGMDAEALANQISLSIKARNIPDFKVTVCNRYDPASGKDRLIGHESALQRVYDYIVTFACADLWKRKIRPYQCAAIEGRGPYYGVRLLAKYIRKNNANIRYRKKKGMRYVDSCKYFVKLDIRKCFPSVDTDVLMKMLKHDIDNDDLLYIWEKTISSYKGCTNGLLIGSLPSQWACQYLISSICRKLETLKAVSHIVVHMDDILLFSSNRRKLLAAVEEIIDWTKLSLHLSIKRNYSIKNFSKEPLTMMGNTLFKNGRIRIASKTFIKMRRMALRIENSDITSVKRAKRFVSYKGYYLYSDHHKLEHKYHMRFLFAKAEEAISLAERKHKWNGPIV